jgi:hypothetical protein
MSLRLPSASLKYRCAIYGDISRHGFLRSNANAALVFEYLYRFINIAKSYFGKVDEEAVKNNFALIYELIDGMQMFQFCSFGSRVSHVQQKSLTLDTHRTVKLTHSSHILQQKALSPT